MFVVETSPLKYMRLTLSCKRLNVFVWPPIFDKNERRMASWHERDLSAGGMLTLIFFVLSNNIVFSSYLSCVMYDGSKF